MDKIRNLVVILGDQLNQDSAAFDHFDQNRDRVWMAEVLEESTHVCSHKQRIAIFLSGMRHFCEEQRSRGFTVEYSALSVASDSVETCASFEAQLEIDLCRLSPEKVVLVRPGAFRVLAAIAGVCKKREIELELREDRHFYTTDENFRKHVSGRKSLRMEYFYRESRIRHDILMDGDKPIGGEWNFDKENRGSFGKEGPVFAGKGPQFKPDKITKEVIELVERRFSSHPGSLASFAWAVTARDAKKALKEFIEIRLPYFGRYQDAMWRDEPWLFHSLISSCLNLKLLDPRDVVDAAEDAYHRGDAPLPAVEGFIRQILGWREYVRAIYWLQMPSYIDLNVLNASEPLPEFFWNGETDLECLRQVIGQTLEYGYAHHIQRLMVTGLYCLLLGVNPKKVHEWYLAVYVDAVEWVELPNTLGMSQYGDGGVMASKPYVATGSYIDKMSNYCSTCPKNPKKRMGEDACPFTTLYWDFLFRHEEVLKKNNRMGFQLRHLERIKSTERKEIEKAASRIRENPSACYSEGGL